MPRHFYGHIIEINALHKDLEYLSLEPHEHEELKKLIEENLYHEILDLILSELSEEDKKVFLTHLMEENDSKIWEHLSLKVENIEDKIRKTAEDLKKQIRKDIEEHDT